jgi:carboxyl-terminal processing protease
VLPGTPAEKVGIKGGDEIIVIDGKSIEGQPDNAIVPMLRGPVGSTVQLTLRRSGSATFSVTAERAYLYEPTVDYRREAGNIGYFKITGFNRHTSETLERLVRQARSEIGPGMKGIVLDLRNNPGGLLDQGVAVADMFLNAGRILTTRGRHPDSLQRFDVTGSDIASGLPMVVLINGRSASSSEIVAAALQDLGRAVLVGSSSYGKGTVQTVFTLPNDGELTVTWAKLYAPSGYALHHLGVIPNVCTSTSAQDPVKPINDIKHGDFDPIKVIQTRRRADGLSEGAQLALSQVCPQRTEDTAEHDTDMEVALKLFTEPALMRRSLPPLNVAAASR